MRTMPPNFEPSTSPAPATPSQKPNLPPPVPNPLKQDHSIPGGEQHTVDINSLPKAANQALFQNDSPAPIVSDSSYNFILNPDTPKRKFSLNLPTGNLAKVVEGLVGLFILVILFAIVSSLFKSPSNVPSLLSVLEDQQEIAHIASNAVQESNISSNNQTFAATANLALSSNSSQLQTYLANNGHKVSSKVLALKVSAATDEVLTNAESAGDFNSTFEQIAKNQLNNYLADLNRAYTSTKGSHGRALLVSFFRQAKLLSAALDNGS